MLKTQFCAFNTSDSTTITLSVQNSQITSYVPDSTDFVTMLSCTHCSPFSCPGFHDQQQNSLPMPCNVSRTIYPIAYTTVFVNAFDFSHFKSKLNQYRSSIRCSEKYRSRLQKSSQVPPASSGCFSSPHERSCRMPIFDKIGSFTI